MRATPALVLAGVLLAGANAAAADNTPKPFQPSIAKVIPALGEHFDLDLVSAGKAADRWNRSRQLREALPAPESVNPLDHPNELLSWVAVCAMVELAVTTQGEPFHDDWELDLARTYRAFSKIEPSVNMTVSVTTLISLQPGAEKHPMVLLAKQFALLPAYGRDGLRWLAGRRLKEKNISKDLRGELLEGLVEVNRREGKWREMQMTAATLQDFSGPGKATAMEAEALFELDRLEEARAALHRAEGKAVKDDLELVTKRQALAEARAELARQRTGEAMAKVAKLFLDLEESWRVPATFSTAEVVRSQNPVLDECLLEALMRGGGDFQLAWEFARQARGKPSTPAFLGRRIGAALMVFFKDFYGSGGKARMKPEVGTILDGDLKLFRQTDPKLADLTILYLGFIHYIEDQDPQSKANQDLAQAVLHFHEAFPSELAGVQMYFLLYKLGIMVGDIGKMVESYRRAMGNKPLPIEFLPIFADASARAALDKKSPAALDDVMGWLNGALLEKKTPALLLWKANLLTVRALVSKDQEIGPRIQEAAKVYQEAIGAWGGADAAEKAPEVLCDAIGSLATLLMEGQNLEDGKGLLEQAVPVCGTDPVFQAVQNIVALASGPKKDEPDPGAALAALIEKLPGQPSLQSELWLALSAPDAAAAKAHFTSAGTLLEQARGRGALVFLAPDLRAMVTSSGSFNIQAGYGTANPFGLAVTVSVIVRMGLFPPAAVDEAKLSPYLPKKHAN